MSGGGETNRTKAFARTIREHLVRSAEIKRETAEHCADDVARAAGLVVDSLAAGGKLLLCGNGGSAADAQHIAAELVSVLSKDFPRRALAAIALTTDTSILTASANDFGFDGVFARQVEALGRPGDVLIGISTSGSSMNIVLAAVRAKEFGLRTVAFTGASGGKLADVADALVRIPSRDTLHIQEAHIAVGHALCYVVERAFVAGSPGRDGS